MPDARENALVTGAASGIGRAIACRLARRGAFVALVDIDGDGLEATRALIEGAGGRAKCFPADVTSSSDMAAVVDAFVSECGGLDTVVSAAGIAREGFVHKMSEADWDRVIAVNLKGTYLAAHVSIPRMLERGGGNFVAISSDAGVQGAVGYAAYCASKHGVIGLVRCMALDYGAKGIRSNVVSPAFVDTPMADQIFARAPAGTREFFERAVPLGRFAKPEEVANAVAHLTSDDASYSNGMVYLIDGGATAGYYNGEL